MDRFINIKPNLSTINKLLQQAEGVKESMGNYLNPGNEGFRKMINSEIYIDKTGMLNYTNHVLNTMQNCLCVSRPRRFGKSMAAAMLAAYYSRECDSKALFSGYIIAESKEFEKYCKVPCKT